MQILHTADWHLGRALHARSLLADQRHMLEILLKELKTGEYTAILISGDIFDRAVPPADAVALFDWFLSSLVEANIQAVIIAGNHDSAVRLGFCAGPLAGAGIHMRCAYDRLNEPVQLSDKTGQELDIYALPFVDAPILREALEYDVDLGREEVIEKVMAQIHAHRRKGVPALLMAHEYVGGESMITESERVFIGGAHILPKSVLAGFDYVALGHLHRPQAAGAKNVRYSGSLLPYSFSEADHKKQATRLVIEGNALSMEEVPLQPLHPVTIIEDEFSALLEKSEYADLADHYISARLTDKEFHLNLRVTLKERFPLLLEVRQLQIEQQTLGHVPGSQEANSPQDIFKVFLERFGWEDESEQKRAWKIFEEAASDFSNDQREASK